MDSVVVLAIAAAYLCLLFAVAYVMDRRSRREGGVSSTGPVVYALSIAVYCTSWTFYGSVGRAAESGLGFLPVYIGPILVFVFGQSLLSRIQRVSATQHITSIADFIAARYGKSQALAGLVTLIAVVGIMPYISLQLKAVSTSFDILANYPDFAARQVAPERVWDDSAFYLALLMALFVIVFGTRRVDATEQHRGMVSAVALESVVKLLAFMAVGAYVTWGMYDGFADLFTRAAAVPAIAPLLAFGEQTWSTSFWMLTALSAAAIVCLPRQFQVTIVESTDAQHLTTARWLFPLYLVAINIFVLPIALAGLLAFAGQSVSPDAFVLALPISAGNSLLAILAFIGGLSAATGMIIVETIALATMISNDLVMPALIRSGIVRVDSGRHLGGLVKGIRRLAIIGVLLLGYTYVRLVGDSYALVSIGLVSFCAAAQFAPAIFGGVLWKGGTALGARMGLLAGFSVWAYTLLLPSFARSGWLPAEFAREGFFYLDMLRPYALFGLSGLDPISHSLFWSMVFNVGAYVAFSRGAEPGVLEKAQAMAFVDVDRRHGAATRVWHADVRMGQIMALVERFVDHERAVSAWQAFAARRQRQLDPQIRVDHEFLDYAEFVLAGAIGSALARVLIASAVEEREIGVEGVMELLSGASEAIETNWERIREAIDNIEQGVSMLDADQRMVVWNRRFLELLDFPESMAIMGAPLEDFIRYNAQRGEYGPGDVDTLIAERMRLAARREPHRFERIRPDGTVLEVCGKPLPNGGFVTTYADVTERHRHLAELQAASAELERRVAERTRELRESEQRFRDLAESASDWFWETDAELRFTYVSDNYFASSGLPHDAVIGHRRWEIPSINDGGQGERWAQNRRDMAARREFRRFEYSIVAPDGTTHHFRVSGRPVFDEQGIFLGYRGTGSDVTELVQVQTELLGAEKMAALGGLVAGVAHEINTPIGIGLTAATFLEDKMKTFGQAYASGQMKRSDVEGVLQASEDVIGSLISNLRRAADLVRSFKRVAVDQSSEMRRVFNLRQYLGEILLSLHPRLKRTRHTVEIDCPDDIDIDSYPGAYSQIITNLVINSLVHGFDNREDGHIRIEVRRDGARLLLRYCDDGKGMDAETRRRIFEPFFTTRRGQGGSGLGMHLVYNLVTQRLHGRIELTSAPGAGVQILLSLPTERETDHEPVA